MLAKFKRWLRGYTPETPLQREQRKNVALHFELAAANKRALEAEAKLEAIKQQRSDNTRRGNATRKAKREAAARAEG